MINVGVIGLGSMGYGMAQSLLRAGHAVYGADVDDGRVSSLRSEGAGRDDVSAVVSHLDALVLVVLNAAQVEEVLFGTSGLAQQMSRNTVVVCCVTLSPDFARSAAARCAEYGLLYLDAPISGGSAKSAAGKLSVMASGTSEAFDRARPILDATAETVFELGDTAGSGSAMKAVNQMLAGTHIVAMAEAITFAMTQGITADRFLEVIPRCAGTSWMLENRAPHVAGGDYTPRSAINIWPKDLGIVLEIARGAGFSAPLTAAALERFRTAADLGLGREDDAAVAKVYAGETGIELPVKRHSDSKD